MNLEESLTKGPRRFLRQKLCCRWQTACRAALARVVRRLKSRILGFARLMQTSVFRKIPYSWEGMS